MTDAVISKTRSGTQVEAKVDVIVDLPDGESVELLAGQTKSFPEISGVRTHEETAPEVHKPKKAKA